MTSRSSNASAAASASAAAAAAAAAPAESSLTSLLARAPHHSVLFSTLTKNPKLLATALALNLPQPTLAPAPASSHSSNATFAVQGSGDWQTLLELGAGPVVARRCLLRLATGLLSHITPPATATATAASRADDAAAAAGANLSTKSPLRTEQLLQLRKSVHTLLTPPADGNSSGNTANVSADAGVVVTAATAAPAAAAAAAATAAAPAVPAGLLQGPPCLPLPLLTANGVPVLLQTYCLPQSQGQATSSSSSSSSGTAGAAGTRASDGDQQNANEEGAFASDLLRMGGLILNNGINNSGLISNNTNASLSASANASTSANANESSSSSAASVSSNDSGSGITLQVVSIHAFLASPQMYATVDNCNTAHTTPFSQPLLASVAAMAAAARADSRNNSRSQAHEQQDEVVSRIIAKANADVINFSSLSPLGLGSSLTSAVNKPLHDLTLGYDIVLTDGRYQTKLLLHPRLAPLVLSGVLRYGTVLTVTQWSRVTVSGEVPLSTVNVLRDAYAHDLSTAAPYTGLSSADWSHLALTIANNSNFNANADANNNNNAVALAATSAASSASASASASANAVNGSGSDRGFSDESSVFVQACVAYKLRALMLAAHSTAVALSVVGVPYKLALALALAAITHTNALAKTSLSTSHTSGGGLRLGNTGIALNNTNSNSAANSSSSFTSGLTLAFETAAAAAGTSSAELLSLVQSALFLASPGSDDGKNNSGDDSKLLTIRLDNAESESVASLFALTATYMRDCAVPAALTLLESKGTYVSDGQYGDCAFTSARMSAVADIRDNVVLAFEAPTASTASTTAAASSSSSSEASASEKSLVFVTTEAMSPFGWTCLLTGTPFNPLNQSKGAPTGNGALICPLTYRSNSADFVTTTSAEGANVRSSSSSSSGFAATVSSQMTVSGGEFALAGHVFRPPPLSAAADAGEALVWLSQQGALETQSRPLLSLSTFYVPLYANEGAEVPVMPAPLHPALAFTRNASKASVVSAITSSTHSSNVGVLTVTNANKVASQASAPDADNMLSVLLPQPLCSATASTAAAESATSAFLASVSSYIANLNATPAASLIAAPLNDSDYPLDWRTAPYDRAQRLEAASAAAAAAKAATAAATAAAAAAATAAKRQARRAARAKAVAAVTTVTAAAALVTEAEAASAAAAAAATGSSANKDAEKAQKQQLRRLRHQATAAAEAAEAEAAAAVAAAVEVGVSVRNNWLVQLPLLLKQLEQLNNASKSKSKKGPSTSGSDDSHSDSEAEAETGAAAVAEAVTIANWLFPAVGANPNSSRVSNNSASSVKMSDSDAVDNSIAVIDYDKYEDDEGLLEVTTDGAATTASAAAAAAEDDEERPLLNVSDMLTDYQHTTTTALPLSSLSTMNAHANIGSSTALSLLPQITKDTHAHSHSSSTASANANGGNGIVALPWSPFLASDRAATASTANNAARDSDAANLTSSSLLGGFEEKADNTVAAACVLLNSAADGMLNSLTSVAALLAAEPAAVRPETTLIARVSAKSRVVRFGSHANPVAYVTSKTSAITSANAGLNAPSAAGTSTAQAARGKGRMGGHVSSLHAAVYQDTLTEAGLGQWGTLPDRGATSTGSIALGMTDSDNSATHASESASTSSSNALVSAISAAGSAAISTSTLRDDTSNVGSVVMKPINTVATPRSSSSSSGGNNIDADLVTNLNNANTFASLKGRDYQPAPFLFELLLTDNTGASIKATLWNSLVRDHYTRINIGDVIMIRNFKVKPPATHGHAVEISLNPIKPKADVFVLSQQQLPAPRLAPQCGRMGYLHPPFTPLDELYTQPEGKTVNVVGIVVRASKLERSAFGAPATGAATAPATSMFGSGAAHGHHSNLASVLSMKAHAKANAASLTDAIYNPQGGLSTSAVGVSAPAAARASVGSKGGKGLMAKRWLCLADISTSRAIIAAKDAAFGPSSNSFPAPVCVPVQLASNTRIATLASIAAGDVVVLYNVKIAPSPSPPLTVASAAAGGAAEAPRSVYLTGDQFTEVVPVSDLCKYPGVIDRDTFAAHSLLLSNKNTNYAHITGANTANANASNPSASVNASRGFAIRSDVSMARVLATLGKVSPIYATLLFAEAVLLLPPQPLSPAARARYQGILSALLSNLTTNPNGTSANDSKNYHESVVSKFIASTGGNAVFGPHITTTAVALRNGSSNKSALSAFFGPAASVLVQRALRAPAGVATGSHVNPLTPSYIALSTPSLSSSSDGAVSASSERLSSELDWTPTMNTPVNWWAYLSSTLTNNNSGSSGSNTSNVSRYGNTSASPINAAVGLKQILAASGAALVPLQSVCETALALEWAETATLATQALLTAVVPTRAGLGLHSDEAGASDVLGHVQLSGVSSLPADVATPRVSPPLLFARIANPLALPFDLSVSTYDDTYYFNSASGTISANGIAVPSVKPSPKTLLQVLTFSLGTYISKYITFASKFQENTDTSTNASSRNHNNINAGDRSLPPFLVLSLENARTQQQQQQQLQEQEQEQKQGGQQLHKKRLDHDEQEQQHDQEPVVSYAGVNLTGITQGQGADLVTPALSLAAGLRVLPPYLSALAASLPASVADLSAAGTYTAPSIWHADLRTANDDNDYDYDNVNDQNDNDGSIPLISPLQLSPTECLMHLYCQEYEATLALLQSLAAAADTCLALDAATLPLLAAEADAEAEVFAAAVMAGKKKKTRKVPLAQAMKGICADAITNFVATMNHADANISSASASGDEMNGESKWSLNDLLAFSQISPTFASVWHVVNVNNDGVENVSTPGISTSVLSDIVSFAQSLHLDPWDNPTAFARARAGAALATYISLALTTQGGSSVPAGSKGTALPTQVTLYRKGPAAALSSHLFSRSSRVSLDFVVGHDEESGEISSAIAGQNHTGVEVTLGRMFDVSFPSSNSADSSASSSSGSSTNGSGSGSGSATTPMLTVTPRVLSLFTARMRGAIAAVRRLQQRVATVSSADFSYPQSITDAIASVSTSTYAGLAADASKAAVTKSVGHKGGSQGSVDAVDAEKSKGAGKKRPADAAKNLRVAAGDEEGSQQRRPPQPKPDAVQLLSDVVSLTDSQSQTLSQVQSPSQLSQSQAASVTRANRLRNATQSESDSESERERIVKNRKEAKAKAAAAAAADAAEAKAKKAAAAAAAEAAAAPQVKVEAEAKAAARNKATADEATAKVPKATAAKVAKAKGGGDTGATASASASAAVAPRVTRLGAKPDDDEDLVVVGVVHTSARDRNSNSSSRNARSAHRNASALSSTSASAASESSSVGTRSKRAATQAPAEGAQRRPSQPSQSSQSSQSRLQSRSQLGSQSQTQTRAQTRSQSRQTRSQPLSRAQTGALSRKGSRSWRSSQ